MEPGRVPKKERGRRQRGAVGQALQGKKANDQRTKGSQRKWRRSFAAACAGGGAGVEAPNAGGPWGKGCGRRPHIK